MTDRRIHAKLLQKLHETINPDELEGLKNQAIYLRNGIAKGDVSKVTTAFQLFRKLEQLGHLDVGNYGLLKQISTDANGVHLRTIIEEAEKEIQYGQNHSDRDEVEINGQEVRHRRAITTNSQPVACRGKAEETEMYHDKNNHHRPMEEALNNMARVAVGIQGQMQFFVSETDRALSMERKERRIQDQKLEGFAEENQRKFDLIAAKLEEITVQKNDQIKEANKECEHLKMKTNAEIKALKKKYEELKNMYQDELKEQHRIKGPPDKVAAHTEAMTLLKRVFDGKEDYELELPTIQKISQCYKKAFKFEEISDLKRLKYYIKEADKASGKQKKKEDEYQNSGVYDYKNANGCVEENKQTKKWFLCTII